MNAVSDRPPMFLAVDPGKTTGLAVLDWQTNTFMSLQIEGRHKFYAAFNELVARGQLVEVVIEKFIIGVGQTAKSSQYDALYIIGHLEAVCFALGVPFSMQLPVEAKHFATNEKLRTLGWYKATVGGHANDATRHLVTYLCKRHASTYGAGLLAQLTEDA